LQVFLCELSKLGVRLLEVFNEGVLICLHQMFTSSQQSLLMRVPAGPVDFSF
jgi:hypothetical protein